MEATAKRLVGVDWGTRTHQVCVLDADGSVLGEEAFGADAAGLTALRDWLLSFSDDDPAEVRVGVERPSGPLVALLLATGFAVYAINPKQLDRFRDRFTSAGAKDDRRDARVLADSVRTDLKAYREVVEEPGEVTALRRLERLRGELQRDRLRVSARLRETLADYFPAMLELLVENEPDRLVCAMLEAAPDPETAGRKHRKTWEKLLKTCRVRRVTADELVELFGREAPPSLPGAADGGRVAVATQVEQWRLLDRQFRDIERQITVRLKELDAPVFDDDEAAGATAQMMMVLRSMPSVGPVILSTMVGEAWALLRDRDLASLRAQAGVAPVTRMSGKTRFVMRRRACNPRLRNAVYHWARVAMENDPAWRQRYQALRDRGHRHSRSLRTIGDRLLGVLVAMLKNGTIYDPTKLGTRVTEPVSQQ